MGFAEKTTAEVISALAAKTPVPGGGGASALVGAVGTALGNMVGSFTRGKKKFAAVDEDIAVLQQKCDLSQKRFLELMDEDAVGFEPLAKAYAMKEDTPAARAEKDKVMAKATVEASKVPLAIMEECAKAIDYLEDYLKKGNPLLVSDVGVGALCCKAALLGAAMNVYINTNTMKDRKAADSINKEVAAASGIYGKKAELIYESVLRQLHQ